VVDDNKRLHELKDKLEGKIEYHKKQLDLTVQQLNSVSTTLELLEGKRSKDEGIIVFPMELLDGLSQIEALKVIARNNGGKLRIKTAKKLLIDAGLIKTIANASNIVNTAIKRSEVFRNVGYGEYEILEPQLPTGGSIRQIS
jgi:hypothetical protein